MEKKTTRRIEILNTRDEHHQLDSMSTWILDRVISTVKILNIWSQDYYYFFFFPNKKLSWFRNANLCLRIIQSLLLNKYIWHYKLQTEIQKMAKANSLELVKRWIDKLQQQNNRVKKEEKNRAKSSTGSKWRLS